MKPIKSLTTILTLLAVLNLGAAAFAGDYDLSDYRASAPNFSGKVAFRTPAGTYLGANTRDGRVIAAARHVRSWETFKIQRLGNTNWFSMRAKAGDGKLVRGGVGQSGYVSAVSERRALWESFYIKKVPGGVVLHDGKNRPLTIQNGYLRAGRNSQEYVVLTVIQL